MKKHQQMLLLSTLLILPLLIFGFLKIFGDNEFRLDLINPAELQVYDLKSVNCPAPAQGEVHRVPDFSFTNQSGQQVGMKDFEGKILVANFFFARCPDICVTMSSELLRVQERYKDSPDVHMLSHTVDPEHDTPAILQQYAQQYGIDTARWTLLTGDKQAIYEQARCGYFISAKPAAPQKVDFIHSDKVVLLDKQRRIRGFYSGTDREEVDRLITEIRLLQLEEQQ